jgi:hypothetical protein
MCIIQTPQRIIHMNRKYLIKFWKVISCVFLVSGMFILLSIVTMGFAPAIWVPDFQAWKARNTINGIVPPLKEKKGFEYQQWREFDDTLTGPHIWAKITTKKTSYIVNYWEDPRPLSKDDPFAGKRVLTIKTEDKWFEDPGLTGTPIQWWGASEYLFFLEDIARSMNNL